jgi:biotin carboxylase
MRQAFEQNGLKCPKYFKVERVEELELYKENLLFPLIVKPVDRSGSKGVTKVIKYEELLSAIELSLKDSICKQAIIEEFIDGIEVSVETISFRGIHHILTITDKVTSGNPHFVELEHHQPSELDENIQNEIYAETLKALDALEIKYGASHAEFIISEKGIYITEVGARMGGDFIGSDLVYLSTGYDFLKGVIDISLNTFELPIKQWLKYSGVYFYSIETPEIGKIIKQNQLNGIMIRSEITDNELKPLLQSSNRAGYFIYKEEKRLQL